MNNKNQVSLLTKTLRQFAACAAVCLALATPIFYLLTKWFYAEDIIDIIESVEEGKGIPPLDLEQDIAWGMMLQFLIIVIIITLALFITLRFTTQRLWHPFDDTLQKAEQFNLAQSLTPLFEPTDIREFTRLNQSLTRLMNKDKETYIMQKEFTENASHELQTPLAIIGSKLDLLMLEDLNERQMKLVSDLYELTSRMNHLNRNLLLLAKIENSQYSTFTNIDLASVITHALPQYEVLLCGATIRFSDSRTTNFSPLQANEILVNSLLNNLIVNAIRHTDVGEEIRITLTDNNLTVSNPSAVGESLDAGRLFLRFSHTGESQKGNGLGLAIVKAICDFHHWTINYHFADRQNNFVVSFDQ